MALGGWFSVKYLPCSHENLSLDTHTHIKVSLVDTLVVPALGSGWGKRQEDPWNLLDNMAEQVSSK